MQHNACTLLYTSVDAYICMYINVSIYTTLTTQQTNQWKGKANIQMCVYVYI